MAAIFQGSALGRVFSGAGSAGPRRLALIGGVAAVALGVIGVVMIHGHHQGQRLVCRRPSRRKRAAGRDAQQSLLQPARHAAGPAASPGGCREGPVLGCADGAWRSGGACGAGAGRRPAGTNGNSHGTTRAAGASPADARGLCGAAGGAATAAADARAEAAEPALCGGGRFVAGGLGQRPAAGDAGLYRPEQGRRHGRSGWWHWRAC